MLRNRNNRLIEQLREKSMEHSKLSTQMSTLQKQVLNYLKLQFDYYFTLRLQFSRIFPFFIQIGILRNRCRLNEALEKLSINDRIIIRTTATIDAIEEKLKNFDNKLQAVKEEMMKNSQVVS